MSLANDNTPVFDAALALPRNDREALVQKLVVSLDADQPKHPDYDQLWAEEIQRRGAALTSSQDAGIDESQANQQIRDAIQRGRKS